MDSDINNAANQNADRCVLDYMGFVKLVSIQVIYVTWAGGICLICTYEPEGAQRPRASANISGKSRPHMLHMLCNTSGSDERYIDIVLYF